MSTIEKLIKKCKNKPIPKDITIDEVIRISKYYGCIVKTGGNHQIRIAHVSSGRIIPIPVHGNTVKPAYIQELNELFELIESEEKK